MKFDWKKAAREETKRVRRMNKLYKKYPAIMSNMEASLRDISEKIKECREEIKERSITLSLLTQRQETIQQDIQHLK